MELDGYDKAKCEKALAHFDTEWNKQDIFHEYLDFSRVIQSFFISEDGWIVDTGNFQTVNFELMYRIKEKIEKHPWLWKMFFMVA